MQVHRDINNLPTFKNAAITIGTFDGVHSGHVKIIELLKQEAQSKNGESVIITFHPHPRMVVDSEKPSSSNLHLLNTPEEKIELIAKHGVDHLVIVPFTSAFSEMTADEYIHNFLVAKFHPTTIVIGYDHHFGKGRTGNYKLLEQYAPQLNYEVKEIPQYVLNHIAISSTKIREAVTNGEIEAANKFLGYKYLLSGIVVDGDKIGRTLGYPTANIEIGNAYKLIPANGIYVVQCELQERVINGMLSIGIRPTVGGTTLRIEVNLLDFNEDIYGCHLKVMLIKYLRPEVKFDGLEALVAQMKHDEQTTRAYFK